MEYKIVVDSCTDLPKILKEDPAIKVVPLTLMVGDLVYMDNQEFDQKKFLQTMKASPSSPKSACPSPDDYLKEFNGGDNVFAVTISAELSGSYNSAELAKRLYLEENKKDIEVINSRSASVGQTLIVMKIKELISEGYSFRSIVEKVNAFRSDMKTKFVLESLDNLKKSGRLSNIKALVANVLNIKPIMGATPEGTITKIDQARGIKKALIAMAKTIERDVIRPKERILGIAHCNCLERAQFFKEEILKLVPFKDCFIVDTAGVSTMYANEGGIIVAY
ncbi:MAG: DegV family protein [Clostridiales bacterium]|jgi:DegV family protein with EDD domain|nr:DegV family protein [Bacillota bacterium]NLK04615.1 DegV family protein [Clostridiales bacterium]